MASTSSSSSIDLINWRVKDLVMHLEEAAFTSSSSSQSSNKPKAIQPVKSFIVTEYPGIIRAKFY